MPTSEVRAGVDIGGTFTDLAIVQNGSLRVHKVSSTPARPQDGLLSGLADIVPAGAALDLVHGSTVATNAFLERKGARTAYLGTAGFEEAPFLRRQNRPSLYDLSPHASPPILARADVRPVPERLAADGTILRPLSRATARRIAKEIATAGYRSAAVCLLFSFRSSCHEDILATALEEAGVEAHRSSEVLPRPGEFERASATLLNAYLSPLVRAYLSDLVERLAPRSFSMMKSSGGRLSAQVASRMGLHTILSGPAGGVVGAMEAAAGYDARVRLITFDMGGTSTDVSLVDGRPRLARDYAIEGWPVGVPVLDIHTIGAGGGSLARAHPQRLPEPLRRAHAALRREPHAPAQEALHRDLAQRHVRVGHGELLAAPVARRPRVRARRARPDAQRTAAIRACDRPAAGSDGVDVQHRDAHRPALDLVAAREPRPPVHQAHVRGRPAHVERQQP